MKLVDLVKYFRKGGTYQDFCKQYSLNFDSEVIEIYMETPFQIDNELSFFEIEQTEGVLEFEVNNIVLSSLFDFYVFLDMIEESNQETYKNVSDLDIAKRLISYGFNNA
ncbi:hypothetical protein HX049_10480 [Myroides odoratimimus]|uniref:hypothetical protein n=1 Tax=Myroides odoratimimus TaxID=76832 RepID=UPI0025790FC3|nr:hypothetical protein [Myroides odoratimimus]MDM1397603.1 hypothetical protein [Myroides odoratimimus]